MKTAHKRVKVAPEERGFSIFAVLDASGKRKWVVYNTCHFGCSWAAYWWSRVAAGFVRLSHRLLYHSHFGSIFVDEELSLFPAQDAPLMACLQVMLAVGLGVPLSWHKLALGVFVEWVGWQLNLRRVPRAFLPDDKVAVLYRALGSIRRGGARARSDLESLVGRLLWFTGCVRWLRPWMSVWFRMAAKPTLRLQHLDREQLAELSGLLDGAWRALSDIRQGWQLLEKCGREIVGRCDHLPGKMGACG